MLKLRVVSTYIVMRKKGFMMKMIEKILLCGWWVMFGMWVLGISVSMYYEKEKAENTEIDFGVTCEQEFEVVEMNVSAYCPCEKCCGRFADGVTASGVPAEGFMVAAPPDYPFGTRMEIPGYAGGRVVEVQDRGGSIKGNRLDVLFPTHQEALEWGRKYLKVRVYE